MDIQQFLNRNIETLTPTFEVAEGQYDDSILPEKVVASACKKINHALQEKRRSFLGKTTAQDAARQFNLVVEALQDPTYNIENKRIPLEAFPAKWEPSKKRKRNKDNEEEENDDDESEENSDNEEEIEDNEEIESDQQKYEKNLRKAIKLDKEIVKMNKILLQYKEMTNMTNQIKVEDIESKSILSKNSELAEELRLADEIAARIHKKLKGHPAVLAKLKKKKREIENAPAASSSNQIALDLHKQQRERKGKEKKTGGVSNS